MRCAFPPYVMRRKDAAHPARHVTWLSVRPPCSTLRRRVCILPPVPGTCLVDHAAGALNVADRPVLRDGMPRVERHAVEAVLLALRLRRLYIATRDRQLRQLHERCVHGLPR